ncbi:HEPN domain-containing protein [Halovenus aranensis]|nr:HEPN domain-containing protein [Halovenus aranensis]
MVDKEYLDPVLSKMHYAPIPHDPHVQVEEDSSFDYDVERLITEGHGVDPQAKRHSLETLRRKFIPLLCDAVEQAATSDQSEMEAYNDFKSEFFRSIVNRDVHTYRVIFPLQQRCADGLNEPVAVLGNELQPADQAKLESGLKSYATQRTSGSDTEAVDQFREYDGEHWELQIDARDNAFAYQRATTILRYFYGILNHLLLRWRRLRWTTAGEPTEKSAPGLRLPAGMLVYSTSAAETRNECAQLTIKRESMTIHEGRSSELDDYDSLPQLPSLDSLTEPQERLFAATTSYQKGSSTANANDAFFAFWRGIEVLAVNNQLSNEELVNRAQQILWSVSGSEIGNPETRQGGLRFERPRLLDAMDGLYKLRNKMVHEGPEVEIRPIDVVAAKTLLDAYFDIYFEFWDKVGTQAFREMLDGLALSSDDRSNRIKELENQIDILKEANEFDQQRIRADREDEIWWPTIPDY